MTRGRRKTAAKKKETNFVICHIVSFHSVLTLSLAVSSSSPIFRASPFYVFFRSGVSSTSRTSDAPVGGVFLLFHSSPFRPFCRQLSRVGAFRRETDGRARITSVKYFGSVNRWKVYPFSFRRLPGHFPFPPGFSASQKFHDLNRETP